MTSAEFSPRTEPSLSAAWANAYLAIRKHSNREISPFAVSIQTPSRLSLSDTLSDPLVKAIDACLDSEGYQTVEKVAFTLFPERTWRLCGGDRQEFYKEAMRNLRTFVTWEPRKNQGGMYFTRLIGFGVNHKSGELIGYEPTKVLAADGNQLEHIIRQCKLSVERGRKVARMQLQAAVFDPFRDLTTSGQPSFPCLQHVVFDPDVTAKALSLTAFYATQQLFVKAYGNWLGLCRLGTFVAEQAGLKLTRFTCFVGVQKMDKAPKNGPLHDKLFGVVKDIVGEVPADKRAVTANAK